MVMKMSTWVIKWFDIIAGILIFALGFWLNEKYAWRMYQIDLPDGGLVADAAWRIASGQVPFEDFGMIQGASAAIPEALFIKIMGPSIQALISHASFSNGLASVLCYGLLRALESSRLISAALAVFTTIIFYPPLGMSFSVQHGGFFMLAALFLGVWAEFKRPPMQIRRAFWIVSGAFLGMAALSKITMGFYGVAFFPLLFINLRETIVAKVILVTLGFFIPVIAIGLWADDFIFTMQNLWEYVIRIPNSYGGHRLKGSLNDALKIYEMTVTPTMTFTFGLFLMGVVYWWKLLRAGFPTDTRLSEGVVVLFVGGLLQLGCAYVATIHHFTLHTMQQLVFVALGIVFAGVCKLSTLSPDSDPAQASALKSITQSLAAIVFVVAGFDAWWNQTNANKHGGFRDSGSAYFSKVDIPDHLQFPEVADADFHEFYARWTAQRKIGKDHIFKRLERDKAVISFLKQYEPNVLLIDFEHVFYMFANKPSPLAAVSIQPGASSPYKEAETYPIALERLKRNILKFDVQTIVLSKRTHGQLAEYMNARPRTFCTAEHHEQFVLSELCELDPQSDGWVEHIAHIVGMDGKPYGDAWAYK